MSFIGKISRALHPSQPSKQELDRELMKHRSDIKQNTQVIESGARVLYSMAGAIKLVQGEGREHDEK